MMAQSTTAERVAEALRRTENHERQLKEFGRLCEEFQQRITTLEHELGLDAPQPAGPRLMTEEFPMTERGAGIG
jgi:hypothetical protein